MPTAESLPPGPGDEPARPRVLANLTNKAVRPPPLFQKSILRLDACFGEWLSPEYFEMITPPPGSAMMLGTAKAELLRREDYKNSPHFHTHTYSNSNGGGHLWSSSSVASQNASPARAPLEDISTLEKALPSGDDAASDSSPRKSVSFASLDKVEPLGYVPPSLSYSTSNNGPIPQGLVAHARDECLDIDYQWDSMREPLNWGDGGSFGEEWTAMHRRFRKGLQSLMDWYTTSDCPGEMVTKTVSAPRLSLDASECAIEDEDCECETLVVIVSHGAGCNALIGAITRRPVLMDVGLASLTFAVRKDNMLDSAKNATPAEGQDGVIRINEAYDLKLFASTDHIRSSASTTPSQSRSPSMASVFNGQRGRFPSNSFSSAGNFSYLDSQASRSSSASASFSNFRRNGNQSSSIPRTPNVTTGSGGITVGSGVTSFTHNNMTPSGLSRSPSIGLWSPFRSFKDEEANDDDDDDSMMLNFSHEKSPPRATPTKEKRRPSPLSAISTHDDEINSEAATSSSEPEAADLRSQGQLALGAGVGGLWGNTAPRPPGEAERMRDMSSHKRRWTVNERAT